MSKQFNNYFKIIESTPIKSGDEVYIMNQKEWCALTPAGQYESWKSCKNERVNATYMGSASTWEYIKGSNGRFQLIAKGNLLDPEKKYLSWANYNHVVLVNDHSSCGWSNEKYRNLEAYTTDSGNPDTTLYYGRPYIIKQQHYRNKMGLDNKYDVSAVNIQSGTEKWIFWPSKSISGMDPKCAFYRTFGSSVYDEDLKEFVPLGYTPRCGDPNYLISECGTILNDYCSKQSNVFGKPNNCDAFLRQNPNGKADNALKKVCSNIEYEDMSEFGDKMECGCIAPILDQSDLPKGRYDDITLDWSCYGATCTNNNDAWKLSNQKRANCSGNTLCIMKKVKGIAGNDVIYDMKCGSGKDDGKKGDEDNKIDWFKIALLILGGSIFIYAGYKILTSNSNKNETEVYRREYYNSPYYYN